MSSVAVRTLRSRDLASLLDLEDRIFRRRGERVLGMDFLAICCEHFADTCFLALEDGAPIGYLLCFVRERRAYCTTLALLPGHRDGPSAFLLAQSLLEALVGRADTCYFTVGDEDPSARSLLSGLGAVPVPEAGRS